MKRISTDYISTQPGRCKVCGNRILPGMYVFDVELRGGKRAIAHSLCEQKLKETRK